MTLGFSDVNFDITKGVETGGTTPEGFLPAGTTITVEADGSGDFETIYDVINFLEGKWSNGTVTIQFGTGTFDIDSAIVFDGRKFSIPLINIEGQGSSNTILESKLALDVFALQIRYGMQASISKVKLYHASGTTSTTYRGLRVSECSKMLVQDDVILQGIDRALWPTSNGTITVSGTITFNTSKDAMYVSGGSIYCDYGTIFNFDTVNRCFAVFEGGQIHLYEPVINKTSVTTTCNLNVNTAVNQGWITGVTL